VCKENDRKKVPKGRNSCEYANVHRYNPAWLADVLKESYVPKEKQPTMRKVMIPGSFIMKILKRIFR